MFYKNLFTVLLQVWDENSVRRKNKALVILKTGRFDSIDSAVIISSVYARQCKAVSKNYEFTILTTSSPYYF